MKDPIEFIKDKWGIEIDEGAANDENDSDYIEDHMVREWMKDYTESILKDFARENNIDKEDVLDYLEA